ncbi:MAG: AAA family ATPase [Myxococcaceae bacterium]|jgi:hypothetical protein|nr:AAA family ATPase [Myxococcaceae bacterium]
MYVLDLDVRRIKRLAHLELSFRQDDGSPRMWTVFVGENGTCKTTLLQAIGMAAVGAERSNQLADVPGLKDLRADLNERSSITAEFTLGSRGHGSREYPEHSKAARPPLIHSELNLARDESTVTGFSAYGHRPKPSQFDLLRTVRARNTPDWFVAGYGVDRFLPRPMSVEKFDDPILARMGPLFGKNRLVGTGFADLLDDPLHFVKLLNEALIRSTLLPGVANLELRGRGGVSSSSKLLESHRFDFKFGDSWLRLPATWLSQGYQSTIAWIADILGHFMLERPGETDLALEDLEGLVLIDELDLHLHPRWQSSLVASLKRVFPNVQFVATTHSPLVLTGLRADEVIILRSAENGDIHAMPAPDEPAQLTGSELLYDFFDAGASQSPANEKLQQYGFLVGNPYRSDEDEVQMEALRRELEQAGINPGWTPVERLKRHVSGS